MWLNLQKQIGYWHYNISECYYHIQLTIKYCKSLFERSIESIILDRMTGFKARYYIVIHTIGFDKNHVHFLCRFLPKYSGVQVVRLIKSINSQKIFKELPKVKKQLWGGEFWSDGYYMVVSNFVCLVHLDL